MLFTKQKILLILLFCVTASLYSKDLPLLEAKQETHTLRYLTQDLKMTYYQTRTGELYLSSNYLNMLVLKKKPHSLFYLKGSYGRQKITIEHVSTPFQNLNLQKNGEIYLANLGSTKTQFIGKGNAPDLHLGDRWVSYYNQEKKNLIFKNLESKHVEIKIDLNNPYNPYFVPQKNMIDNDHFIYTDLNKTDYAALMLYQRTEKKFSTIYKSSAPLKKINFCLYRDRIIVGEFGLPGTLQGGRIVSIPLFENQNYKRQLVLYENQTPDIGNMVCGAGKVYFIKTLKYNNKLNLKTTELVELNLKDKKMTILSDLHYVTQVVNMDGIILLPFREKLYVAHGPANFHQDALPEEKKNGH